jgi:hypothetical protein
LNSTCTFHVRSRDLERARKLAGKVRGRFSGRIDETVASIAVAREDFQQIVVKPFPADAEAIERDALLALRLDLLLQRIRLDVAEIRRAVGEQHDAIDAVGEVMRAASDRRGSSRLRDSCRPAA